LAAQKQVGEQDGGVGSSHSLGSSQSLGSGLRRSDQNLVQVFKDMADKQERSSDNIAATVKELWLQAGRDLGELRRTLETQTREIENLQRQDAASQLSELRKAAEAQARELEVLRAQETHITLRTLQEGVETSDKMSAQRSQEAVVSLDAMKNSLRAQAHELEAARAHGNEARLGIEALGRDVEAQGKLLTELRSRARDTQLGAVAARDAVEAHGSALTELAKQIAMDRSEHQKAMERLRSALTVQTECDRLRAELAKCTEQEASREATIGARHEELSKLREEVTGLTSRETALADELQALHEAAAASTTAATPADLDAAPLKGIRLRKPTCSRPVTVAGIVAAFALLLGGVAVRRHSAGHAPPQKVRGFGGLRIRISKGRALLPLRF